MDHINTAGDAVSAPAAHPPGDTPLVRFLKNAVRIADDAAVRRWLEAMLRDGDRADSAGTALTPNNGPN